MATQQELAASLNQANLVLQQVGTEVDKISSESQHSLQLIQQLQQAQAGSGNTSPEVDQALSALQTSIQSVADKITAVDNLVPDAPVGPSTDGTATAAPTV
jgi:ABC-type transporter Mla subunit MlaD